MTNVSGKKINKELANIKSLDSLLKICKFVKTSENSKPTHTRIGNAQLKIFGGSYNLDFSNKLVMKKFYKFYNRKVLKKGFPEYLTELQDKENGGPMLIDLDFKFSEDMDERVFDENIICDMVSVYIEEIIKLFDLSKVQSFEVYVLLKDEMVEDDRNNCIKDGIHIQILLKTHHKNQVLLRKYVMKKMQNEVLDDIEYTNDLEDVFDKSITSGNTGWLLLGSRKPGGEPYKIKYKYEITLEEDGEFDIDGKSFKDEDAHDIIN